MTKTVCDICGCDAPVFHHCKLPIYRKYQTTLCGEVVNEYSKIELVNVDLCSEHYIMIADFIETIKENTHVL